MPKTAKRQADRLTDTACRRAKPRDKVYRLPDGNGLLLEVKPSGVKSWRYRFELPGPDGVRRENLYALGDYATATATGPETPEQAAGRRAGGRFTLAEARVERDRVRDLVRQGINPAAARQASRTRQQRDAATTFASVAAEWMQGKDWAAGTRARREAWMARLVLPQIGALPIREVTPGHALGVITAALEVSGPSVAGEVRRLMSGVFERAIVTLRADADPTAPTRGAVPTPKNQHKRAMAQGEVGQFLRDLAGYGGGIQVTSAFRLLWWTLARPVEVCGARWEEIDLEAGLWRIPAERMKKRRPHLVPLPRQAIAMLKTLQGLTGHRDHLFPNRDDPSRAMTADGLRAAVRYLGWAGRYSPHATRTTASTRLHEVGYSSDWIEAHLAHADGNATRAAYNHATHLDGRRQMMQAWADWLDTLEAAAAPLE